jgi:hypothetical protein
MTLQRNSIVCSLLSVALREFAFLQLVDTLPVAILIADQGADTAFSSMTEERWLRSYAGRDLEICAETGEPGWERRFESATRRLKPRVFS